MRIKPEELFKENGNEYVRIESFDFISSITVEDLYQAFKERLMAELAVTSDELRRPAHLFDNTDEDLS